MLLLEYPKGGIEPEGFLEVLGESSLLKFRPNFNGNSTFPKYFLHGIGSLESPRDVPGAVGSGESGFLQEFSHGSATGLCVPGFSLENPIGIPRYPTGKDLLQGKTLDFASSCLEFSDLVRKGGAQMSLPDFGAQFP